MTTPQQDVTGEPRWDLAREAVSRLRTMPAATAEANIQGQLFSILEFLFPGLPPSELTREKESGDGPIDVYCRNVVFETKRQGKLDARRKPDGSTETPEEQGRPLSERSYRTAQYVRRRRRWLAGRHHRREGMAFLRI